MYEGLLTEIGLTKSEIAVYFALLEIGSSTTGLAAAANQRKFIGIDTEKKYLDLSIKRFGDVDKKLL